MSTDVKVFPCLEELSLLDCVKLTNAPSHFPALRKLKLSYMDHNMPLENISSKLTTLASLELDSLKELTSVPESVLTTNKNLTSLEIIKCQNLTSIAPNLFRCCASLRSLAVEYCKSLTELPDGLDILLLEKLSIKDCDSLRSIPITQGISSLQELKIRSCDLLSSMPSGLESCTSLHNLIIINCPKITFIPAEHFPRSLRVLEIANCKQLASLPSLEYCTSLKNLCIEYCGTLPSLPNGLESCTSLRRLDIYDCNGLTSLDTELASCTPLEQLSVKSCNSSISIAVAEDGSTKSHSLASLTIMFCPRLQNLLMGQQQCLSHLKHMELGPFSKDLDSFPDFLAPSQLENLTLWGWPKLKSLPQQFQHCTSIKYLTVGTFKEVEAFPEWLGNLTSLTRLHIMGCVKLKYLPSVKAMQCLTQLHHLSVDGCHLLKGRCTKGSGGEWPKISHIPNTEFSDCEGDQL